MIPGIVRAIGGMVGSIVVAVIIVMLLLTGASAQSRDQVRGDLDETDRLIERAEEVVKQTGSLIGERYLEHARELQARAWEAYRGGDYAGTRKMTLFAREQALKAIGAVQVSDYNLSTVGRQIERTDDLLKRAQDKLGLSESHEAISLLEAALEMQIEAREFFRGNRLKVALAATLKARETASRAVDIADRDNSQVVERELHRTDELIAKAVDKKEALGSNGTVQNSLDDAREIQSRAREEFRSGNLRAAINRTVQARDLTKEALKRMEKDFQPERIERFLHHTDELISEVSDMLSRSPNAEARELLEEAIEHQRRATGAYSEGDLQATIVEAKAARELVGKSRNSIEG